MIHRRIRASIWKLLLPMPLAVAIVAFAGMAGRRAWYPTPGPSVRGKAARSAPAARTLRPNRDPGDAPSSRTERREPEALVPAARPDNGSPEQSARAGDAAAVEQLVSRPTTGPSMPRVK